MLLNYLFCVSCQDILVGCKYVGCSNQHKICCECLQSIRKDPEWLPQYRVNGYIDLTLQSFKCPECSEKIGYDADIQKDDKFIQRKNW